jgi:[NiFe] hydrogenase assembly HybE family chaperone
MQPIAAILEAVYRDTVQARMQGLPVYNPALRVEAHGFTPRDGHCSGVLITPWCMNLVLLPGEGDSWTGQAPGSRVEVAFPAATYSMILSLPTGIQPHLSLTLFTTVLDFPNQDTARLVADEVLKRLYQAETGSEARYAEPGSAELDREGLRRPLSRQDLLHGRWAPTS